MQDTIVIGKIVAPHGVRGDLRIMPQTETPEQFLSLKYLLMADGSTLSLTSARFHKNMILAHVKECDSMDEAEKLRNKEVSIYRKDLPPLPENRFYVSDLVGLPVYDEAGTQIGTFKDVLETGSADVYSITLNEGKEVLVAAIPENIKEINVAAKRIVVKLPEWED